MFGIFSIELAAFFSTTMTSEMIADTENDSQRLQINFNIDFYNVPCGILDLVTENAIADSHENKGNEKEYVKFVLDENHKEVKEYIESEDYFAEADQNEEDDNNEIIINKSRQDEIREALKNKEGCRMIGKINIIRVPGNFRFSSHRHVQLLADLIEEELFDFDQSHKINHLSFGDEKDLLEIAEKFKIGILNTLDETEKIHEFDKLLVFEYYLNVVPTVYKPLEGKQLSAHQFTANSNHVTVDTMIPAVYFRYDISPMLVIYTEVKQSFFQFFITCCGIFGGIYMVTSFLLELIINSANMFKKAKEK